MQNTPRDSVTLALLNARIDLAKAEFDRLLTDRQMDMRKRAVRLEAVAQNLSHLKTLRIRYGVNQRWMLAYEYALETGRYLNAPITDAQRQLFAERVITCRESLARIDAEVTG